MLKRIVIAITLLSIVSVFFGCQSEQDMRKKRADNARKDYYHIVRQYIPQGKVFTLPECINEALKNNLDIQVYKLRERVENERKTAAILGMLPEINLNYNVKDRNNLPGSSSYNVFTGKQSLTPSRSSEKFEQNFTLDMALGVIDFGLAYFNSVQAQDKRLIVREQKKRVAQNLIFKVVKKYLQVAAAQHAIKTTEVMLDRTGEIEKVLEEIRANKTLSPLRIIDEEKRFIQLKKRLIQYQRNYENSCIELKALMGYTPNKNIQVNDSFLEALKEMELPDSRTLERIALRERPELYEVDFKQHISIVEARKSIIKMFPHVRVFADYTDNSNKYLYNNRWWTLGMRATYDLLSIPRHAANYMEKSKEAEAMEEKSLALSLAVMSQVHIAYASILESKKIYELDNKVAEAYNEHLTAIRKLYDAGEDYAKLDLDRLELETTEMNINRSFSLSSYYLAYYRLLNTLGIDSFDPKLLNSKVKALKGELTPETSRVASK